jgi:hypothetical protein
MADSLSLGFLLLLESLSPEQRAAFLLHDVFDYRYSEIAVIVGKTETNVRQLTTRARRHFGQRRPRFQTTREQQDELARRFFQAAAWRSRRAGGPPRFRRGANQRRRRQRSAFARSLRGRNRVARTLIKGVRLAARRPGASLRPIEVNGAPGALFLDAQQRLLAVWALDFAAGQITSISSIAYPDKLAHLGPVGDFRSLLRSTR